MKTFSQFDLIDPIQRALADQKYKTPTPIQARTVPAALLGRDVLGCAQTGTGKTAAFALPILNRLEKRNRKAKPNQPFALLLAPTRELAIQIGESCATYGARLKLRHAVVYGGVSQHQQVRAMNQGIHILVATPGRLLDLMNQGFIELGSLEVFVLDEADRMLDMGFLPDLKRIISCLPRERQSLFFSATMAPKITELAQQLLRKPVSVNITTGSRSVAKIQQQVMYVDRDNKQSTLRNVLQTNGVDRAIVFTRTKRRASNVADKLVRSGIKATAIHGDKSQHARQHALSEFRNNHVQVLVATDVAARGIDVDGVTHVVNFDMPEDPENYLHRIGRTGRAGADGVALSFCTSAEGAELRAIEKHIGKKVQPAENQPPRQTVEPRASPQRPPSPDKSPSLKQKLRKSPVGSKIASKSARRTSGDLPARDDATAERSDPRGKPRRRRKQRKGRNARQRAKQAC